MRKKVHVESWGRGGVVTGGGQRGWSPEANGGVGRAEVWAVLAQAEGPAGDLDFTDRAMGAMSWDYLLGGSLCRGEGGRWG